MMHDMAIKTATDYEAQARKALETWTETTRKASEMIVKSTIATQERGAQVAQKLYESGVAELKSQAEANGALFETLATQYEKQWQAGAALAQESLDAYTAYTQAFTTPFTAYQRWMEALTQAATRR
jgi:hypothetical protein